MKQQLSWRTGLSLLGATSLLALGPAISVAMPAPQGTWTELFPAVTPGAVSGNGLATDGSSAYLFAGKTTGGTLLDGLWEYDGTIWTDITPAINPPARDEPAMVHDSIRDCLVLFGGEGRDASSNKIMLDDTWEYDLGTGTWTQLSPATSPPNRMYTEMEFVPGLGCVLFGGKDTVANPKITYGDTWLWDGTNWTDISPAVGPGPRASFGMGYDTLRNHIVVYGGRDDTGVQSDQTWTFDGTIWTQIVTTSYPGAHIGVPLYAGSMCYYPGADRMVWFGGNGITPSAAAQRDTWLFDGTDWTLQAFVPADPSRRTLQTMIFLGTLGKVIMVGGYDGPRKDETWEYDLPFGTGIPYCFGDGSGNPCPCANDNDGSLPMAGCANGQYASGARLLATGEASLSNDTLVLQGEHTENSQSGLYFQANNDLSPGNVWGDGLQCAGGQLKRLGVRFSDGAGYSDTSAWTTPISVKAGNVLAGDTKYYQLWYRNPFASPCANEFNASNGLAITWTP